MIVNYDIDMFEREEELTCTMCHEPHHDTLTIDFGAEKVRFSQTGCLSIESGDMSFRFFLDWVEEAEAMYLAEPLATAVQDVKEKLND